LLSIVNYDISLFCSCFGERRGVLFLLSADEEVDMDKKELKKLLAGLSIASLIAGAGLSVTGCATTG
jgi:radical SAM modification target selenobiotic family peptide